MRSPRCHPAKVGSVPKLIILHSGCRPVVGRKITFRYHDDSPNLWREGTVSEVREDGHLFIDL